jgi:hypothetical protein
MFDIDGTLVDSVGFDTSSDANERTRIMQLAEQRALGSAVPASRTYFGDATWDKRACAELGYRFIAIGGKVEHDLRLDDFRDRDAVLRCLAVEL